MLDFVAIGGGVLLVDGMGPARLLLATTFASALLLGGEYARPRIALSVLRELPLLLGHLVGPLLLLACWAMLRPAPASTVVEVFMPVGLLLVGRHVSFAILRFRRRRGRRERCAIVGGGPVGDRLAQALRARPEFGLDPVVIALDSPSGRLALRQAVGEQAVSRVIFAFGPTRDADLVDELRRMPGRRFEIFIVPRLFELGSAAGDRLVEEVGGVSLVWLRRRATRRVNLRAKRLFDVVVGSLFGLFMLPLAAVLALAVRVSSGSPVIFRQERIGMDGKPFHLLKFRTMAVNADSDCTWTVVGDPRITKIGSILRATSLDELPQLWNVIRGDMSLVGPRPERPLFVDKYARDVPGYLERHRIPAGLTGWAQINGLRGDTSIPDRAAFDNMYIEHWTMWRDLQIILLTMTSLVRHALERPPGRPLISLRRRRSPMTTIDLRTSDQRDVPVLDRAPSARELANVGSPDLAG